MSETGCCLNTQICQMARLRQENSALSAKAAEQEKELSQLLEAVSSFFGVATEPLVDSMEQTELRVLAHLLQQKSQTQEASLVETTKEVQANYLLQCENNFPPNCT